MAKVTIYGASDDLIEVEGIDGADEFNDTSGHWRGLLEAPNGEAAIVYVDYRPDGTWTVALGVFEEGILLPAWPQSFEVNPANCEYSVTATIEVPDGTRISEIED